MPPRARLDEFIAAVESGDHAEVALQQWRGDRIFRERFFYDPSKPNT